VIQCSHREGATSCTVTGTPSRERISATLTGGWEAGLKKILQVPRATSNMRSSHQIHR